MLTTENKKKLKLKQEIKYSHNSCPQNINDEVQMHVCIHIHLNKEITIHILFISVRITDIRKISIRGYISARLVRSIIPIMCHQRLFGDIVIKLLSTAVYTGQTKMLARRQPGQLACHCAVVTVDYRQLRLSKTWHDGTATKAQKDDSTQRNLLELIAISATRSSCVGLISSGKEMLQNAIRLCSAFTWIPFTSSEHDSTHASAVAQLKVPSE